VYFVKISDWPEAPIRYTRLEKIVFKRVPIYFEIKIIINLIPKESS
jgi:hypothetical protein